jgi:hypothetical protein
VVRVRGKAVQVATIKPTLKASGTKRLKVRHDVPLSSFAFKIILRRYNVFIHYTLLVAYISKVGEITGEAFGRVVHV